MHLSSRSGFEVKVVGDGNHHAFVVMGTTPGGKHVLQIHRLCDVVEMELDKWQLLTLAMPAISNEECQRHILNGIALARRSKKNLRRSRARR